MCKSCAVLLIILLLAPSTVCAHAYLVKSVPAQRAVLFRAPAKIQLWFNERLEPRYSSFTVSDAEGKTVDIGKAEVSGADQVAGGRETPLSDAQCASNWSCKLGSLPAGCGDRSSW